MDKAGKIAIAAVVVVAVVLIIALKGGKRPGATAGEKENTTKVTTRTGGEQTHGLPRLVDLGAGKCFACKMMTPILEELKKDFEGKLEVQFIDVWEDRSAAKKYGIRTIPTQIFFDPNGKELFRHEGFFPKRAILAKWKELGYDLVKGAADAKTN